MIALLHRIASLIVSTVANDDGTFTLVSGPRRHRTHPVRGVAHPAAIAAFTRLSNGAAVHGDHAWVAESGAYRAQVVERAREAAETVALATTRAVAAAPFRRSRQ